MSNAGAMWLVLAGVAGVALGGCHSAPTRMYGLDPAAPQARAAATQAPALRIDSVSVPAGWDRVEMLAPSSDGTLEIRDLDHWSAPLAQLVRQTLSDDLDQRLAPGSVVYPRLPKPEGALGIDVDILEFTVVASQARMRASWLVVPSAGAQAAKRGVASLERPLSSTEPAAIAHAWSDLVDQLADRIAADAASFTAP